MTQQVERGLTHAATKTTFAELFAAWLETRRGEVKPTATRRAEQISRDLFGSLNPLKLSAIRPTHVQAAINAAAGTSSARKTQGILRQVFDHAMRLGLIGSNPADRARLIVPRHKPAEIHVLTEAQVNAILQAARATRLYPLYLMAVTTGMRVSELLDLARRGF
jgi:integrase